MTATTPEVETFNTNLVMQTFGVDCASVKNLRQAGWSWGDINLMAQLAKRTNQPISDIANWRCQGLSYNDIAARYNLTATDITNPSPVTTRVAGVVTEYGYQPLYYRTDPWGNPVLTRFEAERLQRLGYSWQNIAVAANIAAVTGASVTDVLAWADRGYTWPQIAREYGVDPEKAMDISKYPFARTPGTMTTMTTTPTTAPTGAGPGETGVCPPPPTGECPPTPTGAGPSTPTGAVPSTMTPEPTEVQPNTGMPDGRNY
jgi:uncharacterized protein (DUF433 family)